VRKADNLPPSCADVKKSGCLNLLEPCGPVQACNGTAFICLIKSAFAGERNFNIIKMHGTTINI
jgi:hypothetical protein